MPIPGEKAVKKKKKKEMTAKLTEWNNYINNSERSQMKETNHFSCDSCQLR